MLILYVKSLTLNVRKTFVKDFSAVGVNVKCLEVHQETYIHSQVQERCQTYTGSPTSSLEQE